MLIKSRHILNFGGAVFPPWDAQNFPPSQFPLGHSERREKMTEIQGNSEKMDKRKSQGKLLVFTGGAALLAVAVNLAIVAISRRKKKKGTPHSSISLPHFTFEPSCISVFAVTHPCMLKYSHLACTCSEDCVGTIVVLLIWLFLMYRPSRIWATRQPFAIWDSEFSGQNYCEVEEGSWCCCVGSS